MATATKVDVSINVTDPARSLDISQGKSITDALSVNAVQATYTLSASQAAYQAIGLGDIAAVAQVALIITSKPATFAGIGISFDPTLPTTAAFIIKDALVISGSAIANLWVKNLDTAGACTLTAVLTGTNA